MSTKVKFGLSNVHYAPYTPGAAGAVGTYATPIPIPGAVSFAPDPQGSEYKFYADNGTYFSYTKDNGDSGDLEMALFPDDFLVDVLGWALDSKGVLLELANKAQKPFALLFEVQGIDDEGETDPLRVVYYNVTGAKPTREYSTTEDGIEVKTEKMTLTAALLDLPGIGALARVSVARSQAPTVFDAFFTAVYVPAPPEPPSNPN
jgi:phi13 family phage major tail protein